MSYFTFSFGPSTVWDRCQCVLCTFSSFVPKKHNQTQQEGMGNVADATFLRSRGSLVGIGNKQIDKLVPNVID